MFREGRSVEKNKRRCEKKRVVFFIVFSSIFREKSSKNNAKRVKTIFAHEIRQKITRGTLLLSKKAIFSDFLSSLWVPWGPPGRPGKFPKSQISLLHGQLRVKTTVDGLREASERPPRCLQATPGYDFASIFGSILHVKNKRKNAKSVENNSKNVEELVKLMQATMNT